MIAHRRYLPLIAVVVAAVQIGVLASMIMGRAAVLRSGQEIALRVLPVDPRDLLRGDYVVLRYDISSIASDLVEPSDAKQDGGPYLLFVRVRRQSDETWAAISARYGEPPSGVRGEDEVDLRGETRSAPGAEASSLSVDYGIERFYVPEGQGKPIEEGVRDRDFIVRAAVTEDGTAQIKSLYDGATPIFREPLF